MTFPRAVGQVTIHYDHERTGRAPRLGGAMLADTASEFAGQNNTDDYFTSKFLDLPLGPRFDFGHGLSYTTFALEDLVVSPAITSSDVDVAVSVTGIAGPGGGTPEKPVGLVLFHASGPMGEQALRFELPGEREWIRARSAVAALHLVRRQHGQDFTTVTLSEYLRDAGGAQHHTHTVEQLGFVVHQQYRKSSDVIEGHGLAFLC